MSRRGQVLGIMVGVDIGTSAEGMQTFYSKVGYVDEGAVMVMNTSLGEAA